ncbi:MAG: hypothetical protein JO261_13260 [Alphaproteobacteria bacterium]|nr:hypothetical protein [Alphaproteobacteria bacterium]MBV9694660.1 hypothetical protein [Alphaproteobacteria bacterium]
MRKSSAAKIERGNEPAGFLLAVMLHAAIIAATFFTWLHRLDIADQSAPVVPVELITIAKTTNIAPMVMQKPKAPPKEETIAPAPKPEPVEPTPAQSEQKAAPPLAQKAEVPLVKPAPAPPKPKPKDEKKDTFDLDRLSALLDKRAPAPSTAPDVKIGPRTNKGFGAQTAMTMDLVDALRNQIARCWTPPSGVPDAADLRVAFQLFLNPDGGVAQPPQLQAQSGNGPYARAAMEAARRAIYVCQPYKLPQDRYEQWRDITFQFDPKSTVGQ